MIGGAASTSATRFAVHLLTASGAGLGLLALLAAVNAQWRLMFVWLSIALAIDALDGLLARKLDVAAHLPNWSGDTLDLVVDFTNYVFVPAFAIAQSGLLPHPFGVIAALAIVISSALYFADTRMKLEDNSFRGFPALWNAVAFYLFILKPDPWIGLGVIAVLIGLSFAPISFVHPMRVERFWRVTVAVLLVWMVMAGVALAQDLDPDFSVKVALALLGFYFFGVGLLRRPIFKIRF